MIFEVDGIELAQPAVGMTNQEMAQWWIKKGACGSDFFFLPLHFPFITLARYMVGSDAPLFRWLQCDEP
jgi:hypothetical protein